MFYGCSTLAFNDAEYTLQISYLVHFQLLYLLEIIPFPLNNPLTGHWLFLSTKEWVIFPSTFIILLLCFKIIQIIVSTTEAYFYFVTIEYYV